MIWTWFVRFFKALVLQSLPRRRHLLSAERETVRDHRDEFRIRRLALNIRHGIAEELLQDFDIPTIPRDLDGVADFRDFRPEFGAAQRRFCEAAQPLD